MSPLGAFWGELAKNSKANIIRVESKVNYFVISLVLLFALLAASIVLCVLLSRKVLSESIADVVRGLSQSSSKISEISGELSHSSQSLSSSSQQQASSVEQTSVALEQISSMTKTNVENVMKTVKLTDNVRDEMQKGKDSMSSLKHSMDDILESNEKIGNLVKLMDNIGQKTQIMNDIVFQTKLLSFNASVEAERAGEHGRGFSVVAQGSG